MTKIKLDHLLAPENSFLILGIVFGLLLLLVTPPFQVADEYEHFFRAYHISEGHLMAERISNGYGGMLPASLSLSSSVSAGIAFYPEHKFNLENLFPLLSLPLNEPDRVFTSFSTVAKYSPIPYIPQATGIAIGRLAGASPLVLMYLGRLFNLLFFLFMGFASIKLIPGFKWSFLLLSLTPITLFTAASVSGDVVTISSSFLLISILLKNSSNQDSKTLTFREYFNIFALLAAISLSKPPYQLLALLFLLIPVKKVGTLKKYVATFIGLILFCSFLFLAVLISIKSLTEVSYSTGMTTPSEQLKFLSEHPLMFVSAFFNGWKRDGLNILHQLIGQLGWLDTRLLGFHIDSYLGLLVAVSLVGGTKEFSLSRYQRWVILGVLLLHIVVISFLLYLHWSPTGGNTVDGWQGRYLIPFSPLPFLLLYNSMISVNQVKLGFMVTSYAVFSGFLTLYSVLHRYYW